MGYSPFGDKNLQSAAVASFLTGIMQGVQQKRQQQAKDMQPKQQDDVTKTKLEIAKKAIEGDDPRMKEWGFKILRSAGIDLPAQGQSEYDPKQNFKYLSKMGVGAQERILDEFGMGEDLQDAPEELLKDFPWFKDKKLSQNDIMELTKIKGRANVAGISASNRPSGQDQSRKLDQDAIKAAMSADLKTLTDMTDSMGLPADSDKASKLLLNIKKYQRMLEGYVNPDQKSEEPKLSQTLEKALQELLKD